MNGIKTVLLLGALSALLLVGGEAIARPAGPVHGPRAGRPDELLGYFFSDKIALSHVLGPAGERDRERRGLPPRRAAGEEPDQQMGLPMPRLWVISGGLAQRFRHRPQPGARLGGGHRRPAGADGRPRAGRRARARTGPRREPRHPDQFDGRHHRRGHHHAGAHGVLLRRQPRRRRPRRRRVRRALHADPGAHRGHADPDGHLAHARVLRRRRRGALSRAAPTA